MSQYSASSSPPVTAAPLIAPMTGLVIGGHFGEMSGSSVVSPSSLRSRPAQNTGSAPVTITTSTSLVSVGVAQGGEELLAQRRGERVARARSIERDGSYPVGGLDEQNIFAGHSDTVATDTEGPGSGGQPGPSFVPDPVGGDHWGRHDDIEGPYASALKCAAVSERLTAGGGSPSTPEGGSTSVGPGRTSAGTRVGRRVCRSPVSVPEPEPVPGPPAAGSGTGRSVGRVITRTRQGAIVGARRPGLATAGNGGDGRSGWHNASRRRRDLLRRRATARTAMAGEGRHLREASRTRLGESDIDHRRDRWGLIRRGRCGRPRLDRQWGRRAAGVEFGLQPRLQRRDAVTGAVGHGLDRRRGRLRAAADLHHAAVSRCPAGEGREVPGQPHRARRHRVARCDDLGQVLLGGGGVVRHHLQRLESGAIEPQPHHVGRDGVDEVEDRRLLLRRRAGS